MARKRNKKKDSIFVGNEYFEKAGISRQVLRYRVQKGDIKPIGDFKGLNLYYQMDADALILDYWIANYKKFLKLLESAFLKLIEKDLLQAARAANFGQKSEIMIEIFEYADNQNLLPRELLGFKNILRKFVMFPTGMHIAIVKMPTTYDEGMNELDEFYRGLFQKYREGIILRNFRFIDSRLSIDDFIIEDTINKHRGKQQDEITGIYFIRNNLNIAFKNFRGIEDYLEEKKPKSKDDVKGFEVYKNLKAYYERLKKSVKSEVINGTNKSGLRSRTFEKK